MKSYFLLAILFLSIILSTAAQNNVGIGTTTPQAKLDVNGSFKLQQGVIVNGISADSTFTPGSDSLLPTQLAVKRYLKSGLWAPSTGTTDSILIERDVIPNIGSSRSVVAQGNFAYYINSTNRSLSVVDISHPDSLFIRGTATLDMFELQDIQVQGNYVYVLNGGNSTNSLATYDVSNPDNIFRTATGINDLVNYGNALAVSGNFLYVASWGNSRLCAFDISDPNTIVPRGFTNGLMFRPRDIVVKDNFAYLVSDNHLLSIFDVSDPDNIVTRDTISTNLLSPFNIDIQNNFVYVTSVGNHKLSIFDVSNPDDILVSGFTNTNILPGCIRVKSNLAFVGDASYRSVWVFDIGDPTNITLRGSYPGYGDAFGNFWVQDHFIYAQDYTYGRLGCLEWTRYPEYRSLTLHPDGKTSFDLNLWLADSLNNVFAPYGNVGIGTRMPSAKLHVAGNVKIDLDNTLEFGAGTQGKYVDSGKIGYQTYSGDALDIVGAGTNGNRKIQLYSEAGTRVMGNVMVSGWLGLGTNTPQAPFHLVGNAKISGNHSLEFGADITDKDNDAGKIGYQTFSGDALDIVGAGATNHRKIRFYAESGAVFQNKLMVLDSAIFSGNSSFNQNLLVDGQLGIGTVNPSYKLDVNGRMRLGHNGATSGIFFDQSNHTETAFIGMLDDTRFGMYNNNESTWPLILNLMNDNIGIGTMDPATKLQVAGNLSITNGFLGIGTTSPTASLHVAGNQKIDASNTLEFGAGVAGKNNDAGKIGYNAFSSDALDIVGAGTTGHRKLRFYSEAGAIFQNKIAVLDSAFFNATLFNGNAIFQNQATFNQNLVVNGNLGVATQNPTYRLDVNGRLRLRHNGESSGIFFNKSDNSEAAFIGMQDDGRFGFYNHALNSWPLLMNTVTDNIGIGTGTPATKLQVVGNVSVISGNLGIGTVEPSASLHVAGNQKIDGTHTLEFGAGVVGKNEDAGKIGYNTFSADALDIVGAGPTGNRKIQFYAEAGSVFLDPVGIGTATPAYPLDVNGDANVAGALTTTSLITNQIYVTPWVDITSSLQNGWVNYASGYANVAIYKDPLGVTRMRGLLKSGATGTGIVLFTLPPGYQPTYGKLTFAVVNGDDHFGRIDILTNGQVLFYGSVNTFLSLDGISFRTE